MKLVKSTLPKKDEKPFPFLKLPGELRNKIYQAYFDDFVVDTWHTEYHWIPDIDERDEWYFPTLLLANKAIYMEAWAMFYKHARFTFAAVEKLEELETSGPVWPPGSTGPIYAFDASLNDLDWSKLNVVHGRAADLVQNYIVSVHQENWWAFGDRWRDQTRDSKHKVHCFGDVGFLEIYLQLLPNPGDQLHLTEFGMRPLWDRIRQQMQSGQVTLHSITPGWCECTENWKYEPVGLHWQTHAYEEIRHVAREFPVPIEEADSAEAKETAEKWTLRLPVQWTYPLPNIGCCNECPRYLEADPQPQAQLRENFFESFDHLEEV
ncbi:hypothetical protein MMC25_008248 [Agyrium rufum]|nr:hypothetical protein [Agyrium rufum]